MRSSHRLIGLGTALLAGGLSLAGQAKPEFEVASVKAAEVTADRASLGYHIDGAQVTFAGLSLRDLIRTAYEVKLYQVLGPEWITSEKFDVTAKLPAGATRQQVPAMLQSLLSERFKVVLHKDTKEFPVYGLVALKGGTLKETPVDPNAPADAPKETGTNVTAAGSRTGTSVQLGNGSSFTIANNKLEGRKLTMPVFADLLTRFVDQPVVDMTNLPGNYDILVEVTEEDFRAMQVRAAISAGVSLPPDVMKRVLESTSMDSFFSAMQKAGLKLERRKAPLPVLVIDSADKTPSAN